VTTPSTAVITGGASGIGRATVTRFLDAGWRVIATDLNAAAGAALLEELPDASGSGRLEFIAGDVSIESDIEAAVELAEQDDNRLLCMVNNAGIGGAFGPVTELKVEDWDHTFAVLTRGAFLGIKHAGRAMKAHGGGSIVNVASLAGLTGDAGMQAYSAAKAAVVHMTRVFATELGPDKIRVNCVCPGAIATPLNPAALREFRGSALEKIQPLPFAGQPEHLAEAIYFFGSDASLFITGQYLAVDGGLEGAGPRIGEYLGTDARQITLVGVNQGNTGVRTTVHGHVQETPPETAALSAQ
jgi:NAD(P)-dependent dehydrogenase (short-subunit alcohol dehydrogenase family)